ncbi:hypothetical protein GGQ84_002977 [Desulfitispora alkaliphila]|uniref:hypothetical protein n=1 Tax=Desulfitispora alkaliphila TaxID=622674 RepID=UPI003D2326CC
MKKKLKKIVVTAIAGTLLVAGSANMAVADDGVRGKNMNGFGLSQGLTKQFVMDYLNLDIDAFRNERREGLSTVEISENRGVPGDELINAVVEFRSDNLAEGCTIEMAEEKITENLNRAPEPKEGRGTQMRGAGR